MLLSFRYSLQPVANPYLDTDLPSLPPLGPNSTFYEPLDFCYRTTMLRRVGVANVNWAYIILPVAASTVLWLSLATPLLLLRLVQREAPKVDPFTEFGTTRRDVKGEYIRALENDRSPFSFLYSDFRREWRSFRSIVLVVKLIK